jgi:hypothetical protein
MILQRDGSIIGDSFTGFALFLNYKGEGPA